MLPDNHRFDLSLGLLKPGGSLGAKLLGLVTDCLNMGGDFVLLFERREGDIKIVNISSLQAGQCIPGHQAGCLIHNRFLT